ncbi:putative ATP-grasp-modified RiPP [Embleya sp. NPDC127516]|uniref:putative ATP-grasp-modified RiPP n=1 Tax=Embleya sp. NPDC127516 TaxID=3363990 RepID=UPI00380F4481
MTHIPWGFERMAPLVDTPPTLPIRYAGLNPVTQTGVWVGPDGHPAELGKHGTNTPTRPPTENSKDGKSDPDQGQDYQPD